MLPVERYCTRLLEEDTYVPTNYNQPGLLGIFFHPFLYPFGLSHRPLNFHSSHVPYLVANHRIPSTLPIPAPSSPPAPPSLSSPCLLSSFETSHANHGPVCANHRNASGSVAPLDRVWGPVTGCRGGQESADHGFVFTAFSWEGRAP